MRGLTDAYTAVSPHHSSPSDLSLCADSVRGSIILRALQGVGGGGCVALGSVLLMESEPPEKYADAVTRYGVAVVLALVLGPILGGAISEYTTWRWIFLIK